MTNPSRSTNPDRFRRDADKTHDGAIAPSGEGPGISRQNLDSIRQPKRPVERNRQGIRRSESNASGQESTAVLNEVDRLFFQRLFGNNNTAGQEDWLGIQNHIIAFLQGDPHSSSSIPARAYALEKIPANPDVSSPWHNALYEAFQPLHEWGARSLCIYWPNGGPVNSGGLLERNGLGMTMRKRTFTSAGVSTPFYQSPAMWMGYPQAVRALLEGTMTPAGRPAMSDPCNVMLYWEGFAGDPVWRGKTQQIWDSMGATAQERDVGYKELLDDLVADFKAMRGQTENSGKLYVVIDVGSEAATPNTLSLFRQLSGSRSDIHELSDWYVVTELEKAGIEVFVESRPLAQRDKPNTNLGVIATPEFRDSEWRRFGAGYYWLRFSDPDFGDPNFIDHVTNTQASKIFHVQDSNYPVQASKEPLGGTHVVTSGAASRNLLLDYVADRVMYYTPHYRLDALYNIADNYRHYQNLRLGVEKNKGVYVKVPALMAIGHEIFAGGFVHYPSDNGSSLTQYTRIAYSTFDSFRPAFDKTSFLADASIYSSGYWTPEGNTYWDTQVRRPSFQGFVEFLESFVALGAPPSARLPVMRPVDVYVAELPDEVKSPEFADAGAKRCTVVPQSKANQTNNPALGTIDSQEFLDRIAGVGGLSLDVYPSVLQSELVLLDFDSPYVAAAQQGPFYEGLPSAASIVASMNSCLQALKAAYPSKKWGFLDIPRVEAQLCDSAVPPDPDCETSLVRIDSAPKELRDFNLRWTKYQADSIIENSDVVAPVLRQRVRMASVLNDEDQVDRVVSEDSVESAVLAKQNNSQKLIVASVPLVMRITELLNVSSNSGVGDFAFAHPQQLISNCVIPALLKGVDAVVLQHPWAEHAALLFQPLAAVGNPTRNLQLAIRTAYAARFMRNQGVSNTDDAFWTLPSTLQTVTTGLSQHMLDLVQRIRRLQGGSIDSPSWTGNVYPDDYVSIQVLPADINSASPSLGENQRVWAACWTNNNVLGTVSNGVKITDVVPLINVPNVRPAGPGVALSGAALDNLAAAILSRPAGRRAILPTYWMYESPPNENLVLNNYYAATSDGTTYTGNIVGFGDPSPLRFMTPWAYNSTNDCAASISATLQQLKLRGAEINMICDDWEAWSGLGLASVYNTYSGAFDANGLPLNWTTNPNTSWKTMPDPRRTGAIVNDSRFGSLAVYNGKSFGELVFDNYQAIQAQFDVTVPTPQDKIAEIRSLLGQYTNVTSRQDFRAPWVIGTDQARAVWHAFDAALETLTNQQHNLGKWASLTQYSDDTEQRVKYYNYASYPVSAAEGRYLFESNGHYKGPRPSFMPDIGAAPVLYGELSNNFFTGYGYNPAPTTDVQRYAWTPGGTAMPSITYMAFVMDCVRLRAVLRSHPPAWMDLAPWICSPVVANAGFSRYPTDSRYFYEVCYHSFLAGSGMIQYFNQPGADEHFLQKALNEWSRISNDKRVRPCSNQAGSTSQIVDRLQLNQAAQMIVSGGAVVGSLVPKYIWRITVAPNVVSLVRTDPSQTDLPATIATPAGAGDNDRGVWLVRTTPGMPAYSAVVT